VHADLTYDPINAEGAAAYPITSPTWILVYRDQTDAAKGRALKGWLTFIYGDGQKLAARVGYAGLPKGLLKQAKAQLEKITLP
jgi:phosphate transport system substrate-binding protein